MTNKEQTENNQTENNNLKPITNFFYELGQKIVDMVQLFEQLFIYWREKVIVNLPAHQYRRYEKHCDWQGHAEQDYFIDDPEHLSILII